MLSALDTFGIRAIRAIRVQTYESVPIRVIRGQKKNEHLSH